MKIYKEIISKSLIDFEEIKFILANNNIELIDSSQIKERYFLSNNISLKRANYANILQNCFILTNIDNKMYLIYKTKKDDSIVESKIEIIDESECIDFLEHTGYKEAYTIEKNVYMYGNSESTLKVINLINMGIYLSVCGERESKEELKEILKSFALPFNEDMIDESIEKLVISKIRRYM